MRVLRTLAVVIGVLGVAIGLNCLILGFGLFTLQVWAPIAVGAVGFVVWFVLTLIGLATGGEGSRSLSGLASVFGGVVFLGICIVLYAFVKRWDVAWDLTQEGRRELSEQTVRVLETLTDEVTAYALFVHDGSNDALMNAHSKTIRFLERCQEHTDRLKIVEIDPVAETARLTAEGFTFANPLQGTVVLKAGARPPRSIALKGANPRLEEREFTNALINVSRKSQPVVGFLTGHGERNLAHPESAGIKVLLGNEGYVLEDVAIDITNGKIPEKFDILFINSMLIDGGGDLHPKEIEAIEAFLQSGGRLCILVDPMVSQDGVVRRKQLFAWLEQKYGVVVGEDLVMSMLNQRPGEVTVVPDASVPSIMSQYEMPDSGFEGCFDQNNPITRGFDQRLDLGATRSITVAPKLPSNVTASALLRTLPLSYAEKQVHLLIGQNAKPPEQGPDEPTGSIGIAVAATINNEEPVEDARIVVVGNSGFATTKSVGVGGNLNFALNIFNWLSEDEDLIAIRPTGKEEQPLYLSEKDEQVIVWTASLGAVQAVALAWFVMFLWRRRYQ
ncbi:MAG: hypothetical protein AMXMBFR84_11930 [Candidatus Hydrogenedentota bacterium]